MNLNVAKPGFLAFRRDLHSLGPGLSIGDERETPDE